MASLKEIRRRISSVKSTKQITSAMKMVAASRLRKAQDKIVKLRPYASKLHELLIGISMKIEESENEQIYGRSSDNGKILLIVVTSNRGLCGSFNANVIKETLRIVEENYSNQYHTNKLWIMTIGKKAWDFFRKKNFQIYQDNSELFDDLTFQNTANLADKVMDAFLNKEFDRVEFVYNKFRNAAVQDLSHETFLPVETEKETDEIYTGEYIFEPSKEEIINELIPKTLKIQFYRIVLDSYVAEHGARMTAMHKATDNATEMIRDLNLEYNKARQASITNQILEVVNGAESLSG